MFPVLFIGHGSPQNALLDNDFTQSLRKLRENLTLPDAILVVSAHWETEGTKVLSAKTPETIHDFQGFEEALYEIQYPAPGHPELAAEVKKLLDCEMTEDWGLDHGAWSVLRHIFPEAEIPVIQLSLDKKLRFHEHFALAQKLKTLREKNILILGSGNIVHNLRKIKYEMDAEPYPWNISFDEQIKKSLLEKNREVILKPFEALPVQAPLAIPTAEHYLPFIYALGASNSEDNISFPFEGYQNSSISMRAVRFG